MGPSPAEAVAAVAAGAPEHPVEPVPLPPIPEVRGALAPRVVYPPANALIQARDSTFIFGSVGSGDARLTINGVPVEVQPNGAFLAFLPVPREPQYELVVTRGGERARLVHPVRLLPPRPSLGIDAPLAADTASLTPAAGLALRPDEPVRVSVRATTDARATLETPDGGRFSLLRGEPQGSAGARFAADVPARRLTRGGRLVLARNAERLVLNVPPVALADTGAAVYALLGRPTPADTDLVMVARPVPGGTYRWLLLPGTPVRVTGASGDFTRVRLDASVEAWVNTSDLERLPSGTPAPRRVVGNLLVQPDSAWVDVVFPMAERPAFLVREEENRLVLTLHGAVANTDIITFARSDGLVRHVTWEQETSDRARYVLHLAHAPYGYQPLWRDGRFVLRVRRRPLVNPNEPLRGVRIAVDAGHPPVGATGPTGLYEGDATLAIARRVQRLLEERGAQVIMTRTTPDAVPLGDRPAIARRHSAHALVSIHLNALPDGVNPFVSHGTGTYYFHPHSDALARAVQAGMVRHMGLRDLGVYYDNLALVRPTWMPAVLCEGAFLMIPEQEAALRTDEFQERYARGVVEGLEAYFRALPTAP